MGLAKSVKVILGIVASGGAALVLSGSAFASDAGTGTTPETPAKTASQAIEDTSAQVKTADSSTDISSKTQAVTSSQPVSAAPVGSVVEQVTSKALDPSPIVTVKAKTVIASEPSGTVPSTVGLVTVPHEAVKTASVAVGRTDVANDGDAARVVPVQSLPAEPTGQSSQVTEPIPAVVFHSTLLPVQPKITNSRPMSAGDLASLVPSAPAQQQNPAKVPTPSQPTGLLTRLTFELASTIVPHAVVADAVAAVSVAAQLLLLLASILLLAQVISATFGALMRRGGYAHAARSDVADNLGSLFATPVRLSYVPALTPSHSSFLMVSETKILS